MHELTKQKTLGKGAQAESIRVREPRVALPDSSKSWVLW